ncbi:protein ECT2-like isoform X2 [Adelges cooleyi]|uniref:protein ECT2-like isoform X2 n=1 Tax=Adelges cooleyi TaxID=133065 RepID=UPI0021803605|nr:protein ECT2-like isoform X2 [Adelges cooleyi]
MSSSSILKSLTQTSEMTTTQGFQSQKSLSDFNIYLEKIFSTDSDVLNAIKNLNVTIKYLDDLSQINILNKNDVLITEVFEQLAVKKPCFKVLGRPALLELASRPTGLKGVNRYRYCNALVGSIVSITGIKKRDEMVVNDSLKDYTPLIKKNHAEVVKEAWFWTSVQYQSCALIREYYLTNSNVFNTSTSALSSTFTMNSSTRPRKRKRQTDSMGELQKLNQTANGAKTSSISCSDLSNQHFSIVEDSTKSPTFLNVNKSPDPSTFTCTNDPSITILKDKPFSPRYQVFSELLQTETNYVGILNTIISVYQKPLEEMNGKKGCSLLDNTEIKIIFGNVLPIHEIHCKMLKKFKYLAETWEEDSSIGSVLLNYSNDLIKAYPPFVNYFEKTREMLLQCDQMKPRFHAFLKVGQTKPECCRQSLLDLLIRPIQRLPSISLLLNDILKHTDRNNPDHKALELALLSITEVMTHINEDKRRAEGQIVLFDIFNEIDNCPAHLISSHRSFITKCDVVELGDNLSGRGDSITIFLFSDMIEFSKKRRFFDMKSPKELNSSLHKINGTKLYKHINLIPLNSIKQVIDIKETDDCHDAFSLLIIDKNDFQEYLYTFTLTGNGNKKTFLDNLSEQVVNTNCSGNILISLDCKQLDIDTSAISTTGTLRKAFRFANKTRMRFGRALSINKTPNKLKQTVSTMISPMMNLTNNEIGAKKSLTPSTLLSNLDLTSCNNLSFSFLNEHNAKSNSLNKIKKTVKRNSMSHTAR